MSRCGCSWVPTDQEDTLQEHTSFINDFLLPQEKHDFKKKTYAGSSRCRSTPDSRTGLRRGGTARRCGRTEGRSDCSGGRSNLESRLGTQAAWWWQRSPLQPGAQVQRPSSALHAPPLPHRQVRLQPRPQVPLGQLMEQSTPCHPGETGTHRLKHHDRQD
ncbi:hypothetical protein EYF80_047066 [Liparis tanakae]|uniref:Uncharacterized protein n=1 Tax=Liparis tanakae TaxID=230148 RepID=A0A4Z2FPE7_9TELE|nr:hypothetical protein EYF80_047066 [Liparis tanakae]